MATKNQAVAEARAKAQAQVKAKERRTTVIIIAVSLLVIMGFAAVVFFIVNSANVPELPEAHAPSIADASGGIPVGTGGVGGVDVPKSGPGTDVPRLDLYLDLMCDGCQSFEATNSADIDSLREAGTIAVYYHPLSILNRFSQGTNYSDRAASAVAVVADKAPAYVVPFIETLYTNKPAEGSAGLTDDELAALAVGAGVPTELAATFKDGEFTKWVKAATEQWSVDGNSTTPTIIVNGEVVDPQKVNYGAPGTLKAYLESLAGS